MTLEAFIAIASVALVVGIEIGEWKAFRLMGIIRPPPSRNKKRRPYSN
jgi:hypothetical protein